MILWVAERAAAAESIDRVLVATDDSRIAQLVRAHGYEARMTRTEHASGTDRLAEVASDLADTEIIVNVQGDEPLISPDTIDAAVEALKNDPEAGIATTWESITDSADVLSTNVVKLVMGNRRRAIYFSRSPLPFPRDAVNKHGSLAAALQVEPELVCAFKKHTGLYVYRREVLLRFAAWQPSTLERLERLEQLRALENGVMIAAVEAASASIGVDTEADLRRVEALVETGGIVHTLH